MTPEELNEIEAAAAAATGGDWKAEPSGFTNWPDGAKQPEVVMEAVITYGLDGERGNIEADAYFCSGSRSWVPALSSALREAWGRIEELERVRIAELKEGLERAARSYDRFVALEAEVEELKRREEERSRPHG